MKFTTYLRDRTSTILLVLGAYTLIMLMYLTFQIQLYLIVSTSFIFFVLLISLLLIDYLKRKNFYKELLMNIERLDKSYLVLETLQRPRFYEGELLYQSMYEINKSMNENVKIFETQLSDFKEYIEMWVHELKIPLSSLHLIGKNHQFDRKTMIQIKRIENYLDQILYYVRSEYAEKDYLIKEFQLSDIIKNVAMNNMNELLENDIDFIVENVDKIVLTDSKWLEFIFNQIINNSIKYKRDDIKSYIKITTEDNEKMMLLTIEDNGIGIPVHDIDRVFEKTFTGENGRGKAKSTGMGLFIVKNLCQKLGHHIEIESQVHQYTKVKLTFYKNGYYDVLK